MFMKITEIGVTLKTNTQKKRAIVLSNYIALILSISCYLVFIIIPQNHDWRGFIEMTTGALIFSMAILLNYFSFTKISRLYLCWLPPILLVWYTTLSMINLHAIPVSSYDGLRFYLLAFGCIPYILIDRNNVLLLIAGILPGLFCTVFCDFLLGITGVGYDVKGIVDSGYAFTPIRVFISYLIISASSLSLNFIISKGDELNQKLLDELAEKNRVIKRQAETEVLQLNDQLKLNLEQLSEREFILNQSQRIAKIGSWEYRIENGFIFWSDVMYEIFGLDKKFNLKTGNLNQAIGEEANHQLSGSINTLLLTGNSFDITIRTKTPIGYVKWFRVYAFPIAEHNNTIGVRGICHDITYFKEAEIKLRASEAKFSNVFDNYPDFIMVVRESDLLVVDVNPNITSMLGFEKQKVIGRSARYMDLFLNEDERQAFIESYTIDGYTEYECLWKRKDGRIIQVKITGIRMNIDEEFYRMSVVQDITEQKAAEEKFLKAFDLSPDLMLIFQESDMVLKETNKKIFEITGYTRDEVIGANFEERGLTLWANAKERKSFFEKYNLSKSISQEAQLKRKDGKVSYAVVSAQQIVLSNENHMMVVVHDITERKVAEEKFLKAFDLSPDLMVIFREKDLVVVEVNKKIFEIAGFTREEIIGLSSQLIGFDVWVKRSERDFFFRTYQSQGNVFMEAELRRKNSETFFASVSAQRISLDNESHIIVVIRDITERKVAEHNLMLSQANLNATINNTEVLIWSVDAQGRLMTFNIPFFEYIKHHYGVEIIIGERVQVVGQEIEALKLTWIESFRKALAGQIVTLEESRFGIDYLYSLSPIIEDKIIVGVSVFGDNITEKKNKDRALTEANIKIGELKLMALRSVMSPHFIFNVLNSIQFFIAKNDRLNAITYLSTFSKLIRSILTHSVNNKIKLTEEIDMLKNYVQLEMVRFENKFNFILNVDPEVDVDSIEIPSLLIQPYVENAILHGLYNKKGEGTLKIDVYEENDTVIFQIEDDGIGREAAKKLRDLNFPTHKSMGINLTEERLQLINQKHNVVFEVDDLTNESIPCGTRVRIGVIY